MVSLVRFFDEKVDQFGDNPYMFEKVDGAYRSTSYNEMRVLVHQFAAGLMTLGIEKVPISIQLNEPADLTFRIRHSESRMVVVSGSQARKIHAIRKELPLLEKIILMDPRDKYEEDEIYMGDVMEAGKELLAKDPEAFLKVKEAVNADDVANICYTSGTTADPKGIMLSQRNYSANTEQALSVISVPSHYRLFLFLPWDHSFTHTAGIFTVMSVGASMYALEMGKNAIETTKNIGKNIREIKPDLMFSVPTIAKNFRNNIESGVRAKGNFTWKLFRAGLKIAYKYNGICWDRGKASGSC